MAPPTKAQEVPTLLELLMAEYRLSMEEHNKRVEKETTADLVKCDVQGELDRVSDFLAFAQSYLDANRVIENFPADQNLGIRLNNQKSAVLATGFNEVAGTMQPTHTVPMTSGRSPFGHYRETGGNSDAVSITHPLPGQRKQ